MRNKLWRLWLRLSRQTYPNPGHELRNPLGTSYVFRPQECYPAWNLDGKFVDFGVFPPLFGRG